MLESFTLFTTTDFEIIRHQEGSAFEKSKNNFVQWWLLVGCIELCIILQTLSDIMHIILEKWVERDKLCYILLYIYIYIYTHKQFSLNHKVNILVIHTVL
jgi:hypothetical protein